VATCDRETDLLITGGCSAAPVWLARLLVSQPFGLTSSRQKAGWRCDYRNDSGQHPVEITAEVYCAIRPSPR
jgi:hypothetical protein